MITFLSHLKHPSLFSILFVPSFVRTFFLLIYHISFYLQLIINITFQCRYFKFIFFFYISRLLLHFLSSIYIIYQHLIYILLIYYTYLPIHLNSRLLAALANLSTMILYAFKRFSVLCCDTVDLTTLVLTKDSRFEILLSSL